MSAVHPILAEARIHEAVEYVRSYFHDKLPSGRNAWTGSYFGTWTREGGSTANELTGDDFVAVSMLSVNIPAQAAAGLRAKSKEIRALLQALPLQVDFSDLTRKGFNHYLGADIVLARNCGTSFGHTTTLGGCGRRPRARSWPVSDPP